MRIALVSDAWAPQVNGVVRALATTAERLRASGHDVLTITPAKFRTIGCPTYPEIRLAILPGKRVRRLLNLFAPQAVHLATEGPLGWAARGWCKRRGQGFTTSFHTRFPDYVALRTGLPADLFWPVGGFRRSTAGHWGSTLAPSHPTSRRTRRCAVCRGRFSSASGGSRSRRI
jgi:hypothetical protein